MEMSYAQIRTMRDALIEKVYQKMCNDDKIFFLSADFGAPSLDRLREDFKDRFINVGIAEQNLINISTGLALEGFTVYAYAIAGFLTMRAFEQIRTNLALSSHQREINVNLIGVGVGVSYDMSGPSHHCLEDLSIMRTLPNIMLLSPSDWVTCEKFVDFSLTVKRPKYIRLDGKPLPQIYDSNTNFDWKKGCFELVKGDDICILSTGYMTHRALKIAKKFQAGNLQIGTIDVFLLKPIDEEAFFNILKRYKYIITIEEAFVNKGGLDSFISNMLRRRKADIQLISFGFSDRYLFESGNRDFLSQLDHFGEEDIIRAIEEIE
ncbi:MAG: transketolase, partial [Planctomycetes bacterium RBG_13_44_8b]